MKQKSLLIVANWKMNPLTFKEAERIIRGLNHGIKGMKKKNFPEKVQLVVCPPAVYLGNLPGDKLWRWGAQNTHWEMRGAYTGEISNRMIEDAGCEYVILGHSERRKYCGETDEIINLKLRSVLKNSLKPIVCIGETRAERDKNRTTRVIKKQLEIIFKNISILALPRITVAYEPVWAINSAQNSDTKKEGDSLADDPNDVMGIIILIRKVLADMYRSDVAEKVRIIYGGSVNHHNIGSFLEVDIIEGFLVGTASISPFDFLPILRKAYDSRNI